MPSLSLSVSTSAHKMRLSIAGHLKHLMFSLKKWFPFNCCWWSPHNCSIFRISALTPMPQIELRVFLVLAFNPTYLCIQHIILCHFCRLPHDTTTSHSFPCPLSRSLLSAGTTLSMTPWFTFLHHPYLCLLALSCKHRWCNTSSLATIKQPKQPSLVQQKCACTSSNLVYCFCCSCCGLLYTGETKCKLENALVSTHTLSTVSIMSWLHAILIHLTTCLSSAFFIAMLKPNAN